MPIFIPEWVTVLAAHSPIKRRLNTLDDNHVVRRPLRPQGCAAHLFIEHRTLGWLAVVIEDAPFSEIDPAQLFGSERLQQLERRVQRLQQQLKPEHADSETAVPSMVIMWGCSPDEVSSLARHMGTLGGEHMHFVSREQFVQQGTSLIHELLRPVSDETAQRILGTHFPESEIPAERTVKRTFQRDNSAKLQRYFLDHQQEWASKLDLDMPLEQSSTAKDLSVRLVNGVAGSGKTLIAVNRAIMLAELLPRQRIQMLILNKAIVHDLKHRIARTRGYLPSNLDISTYHVWMGRQWRAMFGSGLKMPANAKRAMRELVQQGRSRWPTLRFSDQQLIDELDYINNNLVVDEASYRQAKRTGRGFNLQPRERTQLWALYEFVCGALKEAGLRMWSAGPREICLAPEHLHARLATYDHILVDEAQFFAPSWFQTLKLSLAEGGQLFLCGDPNQGFMKHKLSWKSVGLDVTGRRTKKLRWSYRTTRCILEAANSVLSALRHGDEEDYLAPDFVGMEVGTRPLVRYTDSPQDALDSVANEVDALRSECCLPLSSMLVIYGDNVQKYALYQQLSKKLGAEKVWWMANNGAKDMSPPSGAEEHLRMVYLDSATGLEANVVLLVGIEPCFFQPIRTGLAEDEYVEQHEERARKLYMAMTRAGQKLILVSSQRLPESMAHLFDPIEA